MGEEKQTNGDNATGSEEKAEKDVRKVPQDSEAGVPPRKIQKQSGKEEGDEDMESGEQYQEAISEIDKAQNDLECLADKSSTEILAVEQKYNQLRKPMIQKRHEGIAKIPNFWLIALRNHPQLAMLIDEEEDDCLQFLSKIHVEDAEDIKSGFRIEFHFMANPYFENDVLVKEYSSEPFDTASTSTEIRWKPGMDLVKKIGEMTISSRKRKRVAASFFGWFVKNMSANMDEIGEAIKEDLWLNPLSYYHTNPEDEIDSEIDEAELGEEEDDDFGGDDSILLDDDIDVDGEDV